MSWAVDRELFLRQGFGVARSGLSEAQRDVARRAVADIEEHATVVLRRTSDVVVSEPGDMILVREERDPRILCRVEDFVPRYPELEHDVIAPLRRELEALLGEELVLFKEKINFKAPGGGGFPVHQDFPAYRMFPPTRHFTVMLPIDAATLDNGCLQVATNFAEVQARWRARDGDPDEPWVVPHEGDRMREEIEADLAFAPLELGPRDVVAFDSFLPHGSAANASAHPRRAMFVTFTRRSEGAFRDAYYETKRANPHDPRFHFATPTAHELARGADRGPLPSPASRRLLSFPARVDPSHGDQGPLGRQRLVLARAEQPARLLGSDCAAFDSPPRFTAHGGEGE